MGIVVVTLVGCAQPTVSVTAPGAQNLLVNCGDEQQEMANGGGPLTFVPRSDICFVTAPKTASMPLYGQFDASSGGNFICDRIGVELRCVRR